MQSSILPLVGLLLLLQVLSVQPFHPHSLRTSCYYWCRLSVLVEHRPWTLTRLCVHTDNDNKNGYTLEERYKQARDVRTLQGHDEALYLYQQLLQDNPNDWTAGTRIAAAPQTPSRHDQACPQSKVAQQTTIQQLNGMLTHHNYTHEQVHNFFFPTNPSSQPQGLLSCEGPLFVTPATPGSVLANANYPLSLSDNTSPSGLECFITLFLLSLVVPHNWLVAALGETAVTQMHECGWIFPCAIDQSLMVPYVHVFPLDFNAKQTSKQTLWLVTDLHPRVLSTTSVGNTNTKGNTVMYIGPDSLALAQHFDFDRFVLSLDQTKGAGAGPSGDNSDRTTTTNTTRILQGLDLGTGSGIQALSALMHWKQAASTTALTTTKLQMTAVDINPRALRFTHFNALLNGLQDDIQLLQADLISGRVIGEEDASGRSDEETTSSLEEYLQKNYPYKIMLANPPFLPVPPPSTTATTTPDSIGQRYGLFSSGGASGEVMLQRILEIASQQLDPMGGMLGIVAEFFVQSQDPNYERFSTWWSSSALSMPWKGASNSAAKTSGTSTGTGILFVNEQPISAETYASRRADNPEERQIWLTHLQSLNITSCSPGLLYVKKQPYSVEIQPPGGLTLSLSPVSKSSQGGSIWIPSNVDAIQFTRTVARQLFEENSG